MKKKSAIIINQLGLHARAAAKLVQVTANYNCEVTLTLNDKTVNGKSIMGVMMLAAAKGSVIAITTTGPDEKQALSAICKLISNYFGEDK